jgi:hypothetical protein
VQLNKKFPSAIEASGRAQRLAMTLKSGQPSA